MQHNIAVTWNNGGSPKQGNFAKTGTAELNIDESIAGSTTNQLIPFALTRSQLAALFIVSDQNLVLKANSSSSPTTTLTMVANEPLIWIPSNNTTDPITADITTGLYATNAGTVAANLTIRVLLNI